MKRFSEQMETATVHPGGVQRQPARFANQALPVYCIGCGWQLPVVRQGGLAAGLALHLAGRPGRYCRAEYAAQQRRLVGHGRELLLQTLHACKPRGQARVTIRGLTIDGLLRNFGRDWSQAEAVDFIGRCQAPLYRSTITKMSDE